MDAEAYAAALAAGDVAAAVLQTANGEVGTRQPVDEVDACAASTACRCCSTPRRRWVGTPALRSPTAGSVLVADAGVLRRATARPARGAHRHPGACPGPRREAEHGREPAPPWVPLVLAAAEAWRQTAAAARRRRADAARSSTGASGRPPACRDVEVVGDPVDRLPHVVTFSVLYADGEVLLEELARRGLVVASGSACTSSALRPSHVLAAMGVLTHGNVRVTLPLAAGHPPAGPTSTGLCRELPDAVAAVRRRLGTDDL